MGGRCCGVVEVTAWSDTSRVNYLLLVPGVSQRAISSVLFLDCYIISNNLVSDTSSVLIPPLYEHASPLLYLVHFMCGAGQARALVNSLTINIRVLGLGSAPA